MKQFIATEDYFVVKGVFARLLSLNLSVNHLVSKMIRFSYEFDLAPIRIVIHKAIYPMLEDPEFGELNCVRVLWLTIDKIEHD